MYPILCKVDYWDEEKKRIITENIVLYADSFAEAAARVEDYYGKEMESLAINMYEEGGLWKVSDSQAEIMVKGLL